jgi:tetratricopeptide (TPR) repeat protein
MFNSRIFRPITAAIGITLLVAGCASSPKEGGDQGDAAFTKTLAEADAQSQGGQRELAISQYEKITRNYPTRAEPWSRIAQLQFASEKYPQAIVAAEEALQRNATDRPAKSVLAVSGLRVAIRSLNELRADSALAGDVRTDAQTLAKMLRETLGESNLVPRKDIEAMTRPAPPKRRVAGKRGAAAAAAAADAPAVAPAPAPAAPAAAPAAGGSGSKDPFAGLR